MNKKEFISILGLDDIGEYSNLYNKLATSIERDIPIVTNEFYAPIIWNRLQEYFKGIGVSVLVEGGFEDSERRMIAVNSFDIDWPYEILQINYNGKFGTLGHRDFLGAILSLGIKREKIGDLRVKDFSCFVSVHKDVYEFITSNLTKIGRHSINIKTIKDLEAVPKVDFEEVNIQVASMRLDTIVASISRKSRNDAMDLISNGSVLLDYKENRNKSTEIKLKSTITIRGIGKFIIEDIIGKTKSDNLKLMVKKYK
jgi:RNA-binding protein YlmH